MKTTGHSGTAATRLAGAVGLTAVALLSSGCGTAGTSTAGDSDTLTGSSTATAVASGVPIESLQLVGPTAGWVVRGDRVLMTTDADHWDDITPTGFANVLGVSFTDTQNGFVAGTTPDGAVLISRTADGGSSWQAGTVKDDLGNMLPESATFAVTSDAVFLNITLQGGSAFSYGTLLSSTDDGQTWSSPGPIPSGQDIAFTDGQNGFVPVGADSRDVSVTSDGGHTWHPIDLGDAQGPQGAHRAYGRPDVSADRVVIPFSFESQGHQMVDYVSKGKSKSAWAKGKGHDPADDRAELEPPVAAATSDGVLVNIGIANHVVEKTQLSTGDTASITPIGLGSGGIVATSFTDSRHGWALSTSSTCTGPTKVEFVCTDSWSVHSTDDGGAHWKALDPS